MVMWLFQNFAVCHDAARRAGLLATAELLVTYTLPLFGALLEVNPLEFRRDLWQNETRVPDLSYDVVSVILRLAVLVQYRRIDRQTHGDSI